MRLRTLLLLGTSIGMLAFAQPAAYAQNGLAGAYQAYVEAKQSGDAAKLDEAGKALEAACAEAGAPDLQTCLAMMEGGGKKPAEPAAPKEQPAPQPPAAEQPAPQEQPAAPKEQPAPAAEQPQPAPEQAKPKAPAAEPAPAAPDISGELTAAVEAYNAAVKAYADAEAAGGDLAAAKAGIEDARNQVAGVCAAGGEKSLKACLAKYNLTLNPIPKPQKPPKPAVEAPAQPVAPPKEAAPPAPEAAPVQPEAQPQAQQPKPQAEEPAPAAPAADISGELKTAVDAYNAAIAAYAETEASGGDVSQARTKIEEARNQVAGLCAAAGEKSLKACLAKYNLTLNPIPKPGKPVKPAPQAPAPQQQVTPPAEQPPAKTEIQPPPAPPAATEIAPPVAEQPKPQPPAPKDQPAVPKEEITQLPKGVNPNEVAPLFDSAKDQQAPAATEGQAPQPATQGAAQPPAQPQPAAPQASAPPPPAPTSDAKAQADIGPVKVVPVEQDKGVELKAPPKLELPKNVQIVEAPAAPVAPAGKQRPPAQGGAQQPPAAQPPAQQQNVNPFNFQIILQIGDHTQIRDPRLDRERIMGDQRDQVYYEELSNGRVRETIVKPDGTRIVTVRNRYGDILRRSRITPDGREYVLAYVDPRYQDQVDSYEDPGADLPPLRLSIPARDYVLDADQADVQEIDQFFAQPPVEQVRRIYSIDEVKHSARIRDSVRRLEVGDLTFDTGAATISRDQIGALNNIAQAMLNLLRKNPAETFLIEGHTDAVGSDLSNLKLSDARAATIARVLTDFYDVPAENLVTQGYGERYLKIQTQGPERLNRRVTIRRITPLITPMAAN